MSFGKARRLVMFAAPAIAAVCAGCSGGSQPAATPSPGVSQASAASSPPATNSSSKHVPITFVAPHLGDKYIYFSEKQRNRQVYLGRADAEKGVYFGDNTGQSTFVNPHITFYGSDGKSVVADAPAGIAIERSKTVRMTGGVRAVSHDGIRLTSDSMLYDGSTETIHAQGSVVMDSPQGSELRGNTLDWNLHSGAVDVAGAH